jgi:[amino group carrier protein]-L-2-aminoadipate 6-kinase
MIIVKVGGGEAVNWNYIAGDLASFLKKEAVVLVHGASSKRDEVGERLGLEIKYLVSPSGFKGVYTDKSALEVLVMVYAGLVNKNIVALLQENGINAIGLSGADGRLWLGKRKKHLLSQVGGKTKLVSDTFTGKVEQVNASLIKLLVRQGYVPVITQPALSFAGELISTDNDRNLGVMAGALGVRKIVSLFEAPGLMRDISDKESLVKTVPRSRIKDYYKYCNARMKKKLLGALEALDLGVETIYFGDGRIKKPLYSALAGKGTVIT